METPEDPCIAAIHQAWQKAADTPALNQQKSRNRLAIIVVLLSPLAVLCLAWQLLLVDGGIGALILIGLEFVCLLLAFLSARSSHLIPYHAAHESWLHSRTHSELLSREEYLYRVKVGPYFRLADSAACLPIVKCRIQTFQNAKEPIQLMVMEEQKEETWQEALENNREEQNLSRPGMSCLNHYIENRICDQIDYFEGKIEGYHTRDHLLETLALGSLLLALVIAGYHFFNLYKLDKSVSEAGHEGHGGLLAYLDLLALTLPPVGVSFITLRSFFEPHRLYSSYYMTRKRLEQLKKQAEELKKHPETTVKSVEPSSDGLKKFMYEFGFHVQRLVLQTEAELSEEHRRWWIIMKPEVPKGGP